MTTPNHTILRPFHQFHDLTDRIGVISDLNRTLSNSAFKKELEQRNLKSANEQYGSYHRALHNYLKATQAHRAREFGSFVILSANEEFRGVATVNPLSTLRRHNYSITPPFLRSKLVSDMFPTGPKINAWTVPVEDEPQGDTLMAAYDILADSQGPAADFYQAYVDAKDPKAYDVPLASYTIEPTDSPNWIHNSIKQAQFHEIDSGYMDTSLSRFAQPVKTVRYIATQA